jgi:hypothetical protein
MSKALIAGINQVATDKGLDREIIFEAIEAALCPPTKEIMALSPMWAQKSTA